MVKKAISVQMMMGSFIRQIIFFPHWHLILIIHLNYEIVIKQK